MEGGSDRQRQRLYAIRLNIYKDTSFDITREWFFLYLILITRAFAID